MERTVKRFKKLLVANRGEIAIRVLRAASELEIRTVAIFTYEDRYSLHRYKADESYQIGSKDDPLKPYLDIEAILEIAKKQGVEAIHPGYGFLSENVDFARRCREEGIAFIGPAPEVMDQLGDKVAAKELARKVGVPLIEDSREALTDFSVARKEAERIGYPVMVKAAAGGGGRGMRVVREAAELHNAYDTAKREAERAFGDGTVFLEKYIENPKHIEVQILGDQYGNIVHLYERDCSVQRRFQKVVEIAPCITLKQETKDRLYAYALQLARAVNYSHAGTVEFLVDQSEAVYFIEVNPRIQVEHTITEEITGVDLVRSQILIAEGYALDHPTIFIREQSDIQLHGCAIQCRVTTEDPANGFKPDYGSIIAYRSASGFGIRLDAGSAYPGATISPFFDSLLVKVTASGRTMKGAAQRLHRALREFRVRGVRTNIDFLLNLLRHPTFVAGEATVNFIPENPELLNLPIRRDRSTKVLRYLANVIVNGNADVKFVDERLHRQFKTPEVPAVTKEGPVQGSRDILRKEGRAALIDWVRKEERILYTDTTFRDAHQSLLATRMRTFDMLQVATPFNQQHASDVFSMEVWGGATFDVAMRFLKEDPWWRLKVLREAIPNICFQMLLRGSNAVGYTAYPDNLIQRFIVEAADTGIDIFRIFDSLNWVEAMKVSLKTVLEETDAIAEACICYTGDITAAGPQKFNLQYYLDLARRLEDEGAHLLAIKDMAGLLKPAAATLLIEALKEKVDIPIHLHTHDTSSIQAATYLKAMEAGVDVIDVALASMSGLTSQPNFNSVVALTQGHPRERQIDLPSLNRFSNYWETVRRYYYPFETELRAGTAEVYDHEIPGGQYSNLRPQARALGLEDQFETVKKNYRLANDLLGNIIKVTPSSKVVGDFALFMTANGLSPQDVLERGEQLAFPDSLKALMRGDLGQIEGGFPEILQKLVLKGEKPYADRPNAHLAPIDFDVEMAAFNSTFGKQYGIRDFLSYKLYEKVFEEYHDFKKQYGTCRILPSPAFFFGLQENEEILVEIEHGKTITVKYLNRTAVNELGQCLVFFRLNGQTRAVEMQDQSRQVEAAKHRKVEKQGDIGAPLMGNLSKILVKEGEAVEANTPLFVIEAMKMESTITAPAAGRVKTVVLNEKTLVEQDDLILELELK